MLDRGAMRADEPCAVDLVGAMKHARPFLLSQDPEAAEEWLDRVWMRYIRTAFADGLQEREKALRSGHRKAVRRNRHDVGAAAVGQVEADRHAVLARVRIGIGEVRYTGSVGEAHQHRSAIGEVRRLAERV